MGGGPTQSSSADRFWDWVLMNSGRINNMNIASAPAAKSDIAGASPELNG